jgi:hypothetical protein
MSGMLRHAEDAAGYGIQLCAFEGTFSLEDYLLVKLRTIGNFGEEKYDTSPPPNALHILIYEQCIRLAEIELSKYQDSLPDRYLAHLVVDSSAGAGAVCTNASRCIGGLLHIAARKGAVDMAVALIKGGVDVDDHCQTLGSPLSFTLRDCDKGQPGMIEALLDHGADINQKDAEQMTPLQRVIEDHHVASLWILLERGVDVNTKFSTCEMGCSPLILAAKTTRIHHPSRPEHRNLRDEIGLLRTNVCRSTIKMVLTEIHSRNDFDELEILLALGAEVDASCERCGITALEVAIEAENLRAENILRRYGATRPFIASILPLKYLQ